MGGPPLVGWLVVVIGAVTGVSCLLRTRAAAGAALGAAERRVSRAEGVKGLGMALMALPAPALAQHPWGGWLFGAFFGAMALWTLSLSRRGDHAPAHHVHLGVGAASMVYMSVVMATAPAAHGAMPGMAGTTGTAGLPVVNGLLLAYFGLYALWAGLRMLPAGAAATAGGATGGLLAAPELAAACRVSLGIGMFAMLLTM
ncbi:DUF5134 domain-containing protein [Streptomyces sp. SL13]|uniref:DUF5134 domain-containing protein n=1 Tax=Streptantibioticus silvisoli TaxID=2705255 RepID=A0AA90KHZ8_9ACTN|nr:DUF5134 domain-containing protein [Streptantibioticus silvisoli]MDI5965370.1 DUF5134 domain-containing protein [Streptantibioticus silvisoli]MDI5972044.1 DUF5134 domain-containing protein [Streptantibioticus silvisoli]